MSAIGKCVKKSYRVVDICFQGPVCQAPYNETGAPTCFDDKVKQVITGLMALHKQVRSSSERGRAWRTIARGRKGGVRGCWPARR